MSRGTSLRVTLRGMTAAVLVLTGVAGCATGGGTDASAASVGARHRTLVLPPPKLAAHWDVPPYEDAWDWGWQNFRNDDAMGIGGSSGLVQVREIEVRDRDRRSTNNGRVTESSHTTTRTLRRGWLFTP